MSITQRRRFFLGSVCIAIFPFSLAAYALPCNRRVLYSCALVVAVFFFIIPYLFERASERVFHFLGRSFLLFFILFSPWRRRAGILSPGTPPSLSSRGQLVFLVSRSVFLFLFFRLL